MDSKPDVDEAPVEPPTAGRRVEPLVGPDVLFVRIDNDFQTFEFQAGNRPFFGEWKEGMRGDGALYRDDVTGAVVGGFFPLKFPGGVRIDRDDALAVMWRAEFADDSESMHLFTTEDKARGMLGECDGKVYAVEIRKQIAEVQSSGSAVQ